MIASIVRFIAVAAALGATPALAQQPIKIFDSHLHYNHSGPAPFFALEQVLDTFKRNNVAGIVANSRPNRGTQMLVEAKDAGPVGGAVHPPLSGRERRADLVGRPGDLRDDRGGT
jgi:hypothetical protein